MSTSKKTTAKATKSSAPATKEKSAVPAAPKAAGKKPAKKAAAEKPAVPAAPVAVAAAPAAKPAVAPKPAAVAKPAPSAPAPAPSPTPAAVAPTPVPVSVPLAVKKVAGKPVTTTIVARIDIGFGNQLHIRGEGPGLSWDYGVAMENVGSDGWKIELGESARAFTFKFLVNDLSWSTGPDYTVAPGTSETFQPTF